MGNPASNNLLAAAALVSAGSLPNNAIVVARDDVWLEGNAIEQLARVARHPDCARAVGMPDLHAGPGVPIGVALGFRHTVHPSLVGSDAGCGALVVAVPRAKVRLDALERRARDAFDGPALPEVDPEILCRAVWQHGPRGLAEVPGAPDALSALAAGTAADDLPPSGPIDGFAGFGSALGTIGGGNHFVEVARVAATPHSELANELGLRRGGAAILAHSGSRGLGRELARKWANRQLTEADAPAYLGQLAGALRFAAANRLILAWRMLRALGAARPSKVAGMVDITHNTVGQETIAGEALWVHRKGCAPAHRDRATVVLGSRGAPSWLMLGLGQDFSLCSVAHGAGRKMKRSEARDKLSHKYKRATLSRTATGGRVICRDRRLLYEEHPDAYKDIEPVIASLEDIGAARRAAAFEPLLTVKL